MFRSSQQRVAPRATRHSAIARAALIALLASIAAGLASAQTSHPSADLAMRGGEPLVRARLIAHPDDLGSETVRAGVYLEIASGWHIYGAEAGDTGIPTEVNWSSIAGAIEPAAWPPTVAFDLPEVGLSGAGYIDRVLLPAIASGLEPGASVQADVSLLVCRDECIPARATLTLPLDAAPRDGIAADRARSAFAGVAPETSVSPTALLQVLALALVGGLLLNLMPCVLPVLAIKALALADLASSSRKEAQHQAIAYAAGVQASLLTLAAVVAAMRAAGGAVGWGFQFQEPAYLAALGALLVLFALNLFGVFEINASPSRLAAFGAQAAGTRRSFWDGLLTVALATPCSAPFLGTAVGFALTGAAVWIFPVFAAIGVGLALPLALVGANPRWVRWLPRPGAWMQELRVWLGFGLMATVVWLAWILGRNADVDVAARWLAWLLALACLAWRFGVRQRAGRRTPAWFAAVAAVALLALGAGAVRTQPLEADSESLTLAAQPWSRGAVEASLRDGQPALVIFTADWCITCKANERLVLSDSRIAEALAAGNFAVYEGDWTRADPDIARELARFGRAGVPFYAIFAPETQPQLLPELLSVDGVLGALATAERIATVSRVTRAAHAPTMQPVREH
jgi:thiol:disulfide interchange protein